ncbi:PREDICTED: transmembrane protein 143-like [Branchiostoma belcheri]|uniref:Transmembrane protein 143-like n=1 Tax=Branchiostoma belcheri TaxID=7741 RepID=A0A6P5A9X2_BRABE|nr:PREDICTED: transmembrane protein 143-like [Branchiostoma belcheri]
MGGPTVFCCRVGNFRLRILSLGLHTSRNNYSAAARLSSLRSKLKWPSTAAAAAPLPTPPADTPVPRAPLLGVPSEEEFPERFIPITRRSLVMRLMQRMDGIIPTTYLDHFSEFSDALDTAITDEYHKILIEMKHVFDPINPDKETMFDPVNPDKETVATRHLTEHERVENEFFLIQKLSSLIKKASYVELPRHVVVEALQDHVSEKGVMVDVNPDAYAILKFWAFGKEEILEQTPAWYSKVYSKLANPAQKEPKYYYKRVVVAARLKKDQQLILKGFKDIPCKALEHLLPDARIRMTRADKGMVYTTILVALFGVIIQRLVLVMASLEIPILLMLAATIAFVVLRSWTVYKNRRNLYLLELSRTLYFKNVSSNRGLLTALVDRAQEESVKQALLVYTFLLGRTSPLELEAEDEGDIIRGGITVFELEELINRWILLESGSKIVFDSSDAIKLLETFGILTGDDIDDDRRRHLYVLPIEAALRQLPQQSMSHRHHQPQFDVQQVDTMAASIQGLNETMKDFAKNVKARLHIIEKRLDDAQGVPDAFQASPNVKDVKAEGVESSTTKDKDMVEEERRSQKDQTPVQKNDKV